MTLVELNAHIDDGSIDDIIAVAESRQRKRLGQIADLICEKGARLVLLAGGSSCGKTTTAKRLKVQLGVNERSALSLSTDDYFVGDKYNPRDENGEFDYEHVDCVDSERLVADINALLAGDDIPERRFDFINHVPTYTEKRLKLAEGGVIVLEGIHALNPKLSAGVEEAAKFRLAIDTKPSIDVFGGIYPKSSEARFLRRLVRDNHFRKVEPSATLKMWPKVIAGEKKWIEPYRALAEVEFDSYLVYELAVLKPYVGGILERLRREVGEVTEVMNMIRLLNPITAIDATKVPSDSILRETIGGSIIDY